MRVLQISKWYLPYTGGIETTVHYIASGLIERGAFARVLTCHRHCNLQNAHEHIDGVEVVRALSLGNLFSTPVSPSFPAFYRRQARWADVLHFHVPFPLAALVHSWAPLQSKPVVVTFHADPANTRWGKLAALYQPILNRLLARADCIVTTSPPLQEAAPSLQPFQQKCRVIPLATSLEAKGTEEDAQRLRQRLGIGAKPIVLGVGRMVYYKGFQYLLEAMVEVDGHLVLVGKGGDLKKLKHQAKALGIDHRVHFGGYVPDEELTHYYAAADIFALPSVSAAEAFGIVQVEAMAHGLPVVNTDLPTGVPFVSLHGETGLTVPPGDAKALAAALVKLLEDECLRKEFSSNARRRAQRFSLQQMRDDYNNLLYKLYKDSAVH